MEPYWIYDPTIIDALRTHGFQCKQPHLLAVSLTPDVVRIHAPDAQESGLSDLYFTDVPFTLFEVWPWYRHTLPDGRVLIRGGTVLEWYVEQEEGGA